MTAPLDFDTLKLALKRLVESKGNTNNDTFWLACEIILPAVPALVAAAERGLALEARVAELEDELQSVVDVVAAALPDKGETSLRDRPDFYTF